MRIFKNWKSELKKKGAMALTAFMLCGSAGTAFAQSPIFIHDDASGDEDSTTGDRTLGNKKTVTGYQTDIAEGYAVRIDWGDMIFVYDRGTYDPTTGQLVESSTEIEQSATDGEGAILPGDPEKTTVTYSEAYIRCHDPENLLNERTIGYWYATDGNHIKIQNLSTDAVYTKISPVKNEGNNITNVHLQILGCGDSSNEDTDSSNEDTEFCKLNGTEGHYKTITVDDFNGNTPPAESGEIIVSEDHLYSYISGATRNESGVIDKEYYTNAYVNVYGKPSPAFRNATDFGTQGGEKIGEITISFNKATLTDGNYSTGDSLDPINGDQDAGSGV